jgi:3-hydroxybutyryl-CoA dehydrogenase
MEIELVGVVGAGVMGGGVAQALAQTGHQVVLIDVCEEILTKAAERIKNEVRLQMMFDEKLRQGTAEAVVDRIQCTMDYGLLSEADFVIENVPENWEVKKAVFQRLDGVCPEPCVLASDTSAIPITRIASVTKRPDRVIGLHFMNPVPMKPAVEMIRGFHTSSRTIERTKTLLSQLKKEWILVNDSPGFVSNRVLMLTINEAIFLLAEQVAPAEEIDRIFTSCFGHKMGPLETADLIGLDTVLHSIEVLYDSYGGSKYRPCPLLRKMVDAGYHGRKTGKGFYNYTA